MPFRLTVFILGGRIWGNATFLSALTNHFEKRLYIFFMIRKKLNVRCIFERSALVNGIWVSVLLCLCCQTQKSPKELNLDKGALLGHDGNRELIAPVMLQFRISRLLPSNLIIFIRTLCSLLNIQGVSSDQCFQFILRWPLQGSRGQGIWTLNLGTWWTCGSGTGGKPQHCWDQHPPSPCLHSVLLCLTHRPSLSEMTGKSFERIFLITQEMEWKTSALSVHWNAQELDYLWWECQLGEMFLDLVRLSVIPIPSDAAEKASFWKSGDWDNSLVLPRAVTKEARVNFSGSQPFYTYNEVGSYISLTCLKSSFGRSSDITDMNALNSWLLSDLL